MISAATGAAVPLPHTDAAEQESADANASRTTSSLRVRCGRAADSQVFLQMPRPQKATADTAPIVAYPSARRATDCADSQGSKKRLREGGDSSPITAPPRQKC